MGINAMKNFDNYNECPYKEIKLFVSITLLFMSSTILNAEDYQLASVSDNSKPFDLPSSKKEGTGFSAKIFNDVNRNGVQDKDENGTAGVTVKLFDVDGNEINVGPDGILGNEDDSPGGVITNENGRYFFSKITHSFFRIKVR